MILSYGDLVTYWKRKKIRFDPDISRTQIGFSSIDLRMGEVATELIQNPGITIRPATSIPQGIFENKPISNYLRIKPRQLILVLTKESITLPANLCGEVQGRSSFARYGLAIHITSPHIHPLFSGPITLELYNHGPNDLEIWPGDPICQLILSRVSRPVPRSFQNIGRYRQQKTPTPVPLS